MNDKPIGVFDSGAGGLTAVRELHRLMPGENIIYFGDTGRAPYGTRSKETIIKYAKQAVNFLISRDVKAVIAACGTVSTVFDEKAARSIGVTVPYTGIVMPAVRTACTLTANGRVGVIATAASIRTGAYGRAVRSISPSVKVFGNACPLLVSLVENGMIEPDNKLTRLAVEMYLAPMLREEIDTLILGCTHFPILYDIINDVLGYKITLIDPSACAVRELQTELMKLDLLSGAEKGRTEYYVTDSAEQITSIAKSFMREDIGGQVTHIDVEAIDT